MDRADSLNLPSSSSTDSEAASASIMKKKKKSKRAASRRSAIESSGDSSSEDIVTRPRTESKHRRTLVSSSGSGDGSDPVVSGNPRKFVLLSSSSDNIVPSNSIPSTSRGFVHNTPSTSSSSSPITIARKNLTSVIRSDDSTSSDVLVHPSRRVRYLPSESPSTSSNAQPMSTDDEDEGPRSFVPMNSKKNKLSSTESSEDEDCPCCAICLSSLANRIAAQISGCNHEFHNTCILKWSERTNTCPIDRSKFNKITVRNKQGQIVKVTDIEDNNAATADDDEPAFPDEAINCMICNHPDNEDVLLLCDGCNRGFHIYCLTPPLASVPEGNWICEHCSPVISLSDSIYFDNALDISIENYSDNSNPSDMDASSNEDSGENQPSTSRRRRVGRHRSGSTLTVSVSSRNQNLLRNSRVRHTTITIKQTRKRKRRSTRRRRRHNVQSTVSQRSRIMAAAIAKRSAAACESGGGSVGRKHREKTLRSEPGRPRLSLFSSDNFEDYYNPESDGEGEGGGVAVTARTRYPMSRVMDRKAAVARLINTNRRPRVAPRVSITDVPNTSSSLNVLDDIMGMMEVESKKSTGTIPIKKDGTFAVPARVNVNADKNKEKVTETPGYPGGGVPHRPRGHYSSPAGNYQPPSGARHQSGVFSAQGTLPFTPRFSSNFPPGRSGDNFHLFRTPPPRFRSNTPRRFPSRRSLPASLLMEADVENEDSAQPDEDVDIYGDIGSGPLLPPPQPPATLFNITPPLQPPAELILSAPPQPPAGLLNLGSPEEGPSDEEKGLIIDDKEYDPADPCDSPGAVTNAPSLPSDDSSDSLGAIPKPDSDHSSNSNNLGAIPKSDAIKSSVENTSANSSRNLVAPPITDPSDIFSGKLGAFSLLDLSTKCSGSVVSSDNASAITIPVPPPISDSVHTIPIPSCEPPAYGCAPPPQSDSEDEECPNSSLYSSTSLKLARKKAIDKESSDNSDAEESPVKNNDSVLNLKTGPIRFSIGTKFSAKKNFDLFSEEEEEEEDDNDENTEDNKHADENVNERDVEKEVKGNEGGGVVTYESSDEEKNIPEKNIAKDNVNKVGTEDMLAHEEKSQKKTVHSLKKGPIVEDQLSDEDDKLSYGGDNKEEDEALIRGGLKDNNPSPERNIEVDDILSEDGNHKEEDEADNLSPLKDENKTTGLEETSPRGRYEKKTESIDLQVTSPHEDSFEMSPDKTQQDEEKYLEDEILGSDKAEDNELDKDEVSTQGDILDLNTENLQGVTDVTVHDGTLQDNEDPNKSDSYNGLDGLDVDPVSDSEYGSLSDNADENGEKSDKKKKKKRKITEREEGEIVEPKKKDRKKDKDENNENSSSEKKTKRNKKDKDFVEMSPLQEKTLSNNMDNLDQFSSESVAWKKLSKNTKDRNYREKDELKGRKKKEGRKEIERYNVRKIVGEKALVRKDEFGRDISPQSRSRSPSFSRSPRKRSISPPRKRSISPSRKRSISPPRKRSRSPRKRSLSRSPERRNKKWRSRSRSLDRFRNRSLSHSPVRARKRSPKLKERKQQKNRGRSGSRRRRSRTPRKRRSRSRSKPKKPIRSQVKGKLKLKSKPVSETLKSKDGKKKKKKQGRSPSNAKARSPRGRSPWDFSSTSISRSPTPAPPETFTRSRSWSREKNLTVIVPNMNKKKDKKKGKENRRRKHKDDNSPTLSKEVFTSGDNILVSVNFAHAEKPPPPETPASKVEKVKAPVKRSKKDIAAMKAAKVREMAAKAKPVAIIDLDVSPFRERTPSPKEVIVLCDSDSENEAPPAKVQDLKAISSGPKTPPEPHIKFAISSKNQTISTIVNPLLDDEDKQGPNTPPEPPSPLPTSPYDPFDPTKSRSPSPTLQSAPSDNLLDMKTQSDNVEKTQLDLLKPSSTPSKDSMQSPAKVTSDEANITLSKQEDKQVTSTMSTTIQNSLPVYTPAMTNTAARNNNGAEAMEDILNLDSDGVYSPGSSLGDDLFDPPKKSPPPSNVNVSKKFDSLFVSKSSSKSIPYEPKLTKPLLPTGTPKKSAPPKYTPTKTKAKPVAISKLDEDQLKILDEVPSSAVEMQVKYKYLKKLNRQERVVEEVKHVLKPHYNKKHVTKEQYKDILRKSVPKICHNKSGEINPMKIQQLIEAYVKKYRIMNKKRTGVVNPVTSANNQHSNMNGAKKKSMWT